ncbi:mCG1032085 [Mus musculus]|nr:mCG1032085 [Mus musculus]
MSILKKWVWEGYKERVWCRYSNSGLARLRLLGRFSDSFSATNITNTWQWASSVGTHMGSRSGQSIVHLYFSKSVKLVLLTMTSILPISGLL